MSREQSDGEDSVVGNGIDRFVDATAEMEEELRLSLEVDMEPDRIRKDIPIYPTRSGPDMGCSYPALRKPVGSYRGPGHSRWDSETVGAHNQPDVPGTGPAPTERWDTASEASTRSICFRYTDPAYLSSDKELPGLGAQSGFDRFKDSLPNMTGSGLRNELPGRSEGSDPTRPPEAELMDTVASLQLEVEALKFGQIGRSTLGGQTSLVWSKQVVFTSTKVPKLTGVTSWEQYRQVFDAIARFWMGGTTLRLPCSCCLTWKATR